MGTCLNAYVSGERHTKAGPMKSVASKRAEPLQAGQVYGRTFWHIAHGFFRTSIV